MRALRGGNEIDTRLESSVAVPGLYSLQASNMQMSVANNERDEPNQVLIITLVRAIDEPGRADSRELRVAVIP